MTKRFASVLGLLAIICLALQPSAAMALDVKKTEATGAEAALASKEFFKPELHISSSNVRLDEAFDGLSNKSAWTQFSAAYGSAEVYLDPRSGVATSVVTSVPLIPGRNGLDLEAVSAGLGRRVIEVDRRAVGDLVRRFILDNREAIGIDASQLGPGKVEPVSDHLWNVRFPQTYNGIPVRYGALVAVINNGNLVLFGTETWGNVNLDPRPALTGNEALSIGFAHAGGRLSTDDLWKKPELEIVPVAPQEYQSGEAFSGPMGGGYRHRLVWAFGFQRKGQDARYEVLVDAHTREVISFEDQNHYDTKKMTGGIYGLTNTEVCPSNDRCGTMFPDYPMPFADTGLAPPNDFTNSAGLFNYTSGTATTHLAGKFVAIGDSCGAVNESAPGDILLGGVNGQHDCVTAGSSAGDTASARSAFYEVNKLKEQARGWLPANAWLQAQLQTNVNIANTCNAFYSPSAGNLNFYRSGGGCRNTGEIAAVFDHEWGHGMDDNDTGGALSNSSEIYADITAVLRLQASCVGYGFWWTADQGCGMTADGTGFNGDESQVAATHCNLDCSGVRGADWDKHADHNPDTPTNFICVFCASGSGPCGREVHCENAPGNQTAWDLANRDLEAPPFNMTTNDAFIVANKVFYQGSGLIGNWETCTCPGTSNGCGATNAYLQWLAADDDDGNLSNGTPHMTAIFAAFNRHGIACATPTPQNSGCAGGPTTAPNLTVAVGSNSLNLSWTAVPGAISYRVLRSEGFGGCDFGKAVIANVGGTSYLDPDAANGRSYNYVVQAVGSNSACYGPGSACVTGVPQPCAGTVSLTQDLYNCGGAPLQITLVDGDLTGTMMHDVSVSSNTEHGPETVHLTENPPGSGVFTGTFGTTTDPAAPNDNAISISDGDTIAVDYLDVDYCGTPNVTVTKFATVDCANPIITNVQVTNITGNSADVTFDTNEPTDAVVHYGTAPPPTSTASNATLTTSHTVHIAGLDGCTAYLFSVSVTDPAGNSASDNNGGSYYGFITLVNVNPTFPYTGPPVAIPDNTTVTASISIADTRIVQDVNVTVGDVTHTYDGDLLLTLIGPNGTRVTLSNRRGVGGDNYTNTVFDDEASTPIASGAAPFTGSFIPDAPLSAVDGIPANGTWTLEIQDLANVDTGFLNAWQIQLSFPAEQCPTVGRVTLDKTSYQCGETVQIQVVDFSITGAGSQNVTIQSNTEPGGETVMLTETPANSANFIGTIQLTTTPSVSGQLTVSNGDTITVTYIDVDDGYGGMNIPRTDTALVDCAPPVISNVQAQNVSGRSADLTWSTNEGANSAATYGSPSPVTPVSDAAVVTSHSLHVSGLTPCTTYSFYVQSTDTTGNQATANNGGAYFSFTTLADSQPTFSYSGAAVPIPDNNATGASASIAISDVKEIQDVNVTLTIAHANVGDLEVYLVAPGGQTVPLALRRGGTGDNFTNTVLDDSAATPISGGTAPFTGSFRPETPLSALNGLLTNGTWNLNVKDRAAGTTGSITTWSIQLTYPPLACGAPYVQEGSHSVTDNCSGSGNGAADPGETLTIPVQVANTGNGPATNVVGTLISTDPDVAVLDDTTSYGSLALGQFSSGDGPFVVSVGSSVPCGATITLQLHVTSNEGSWNDSFTVQIGSPVNNTATYNSTDTPKPIPDVRTPPVLSTIAVADTAMVTDVNVRINIQHTYDGDLDIFLIGPNGTRVELTTDNGNGQANFVNTVFDDQAPTSITTGAGPFTGSFKPEGLLSALNGIAANGNWTLEITDDANIDSGVLQDWSLIITTPSSYSCSSCSAPPPPGEATQLVFTSRTDVQWTAAPNATYHYLYRGDPGDLPYLYDATTDSCQRAGSGSLAQGGLTELPASETFEWYLVRGWNTAGYGPSGNNTAGPRVQDSGGTCP